jgi:hypothetical protein
MPKGRHRKFDTAHLVEGNDSNSRRGQNAFQTRGTSLLTTGAVRAPCGDSSLELFPKSSFEKLLGEALSRSSFEKLFREAPSRSSFEKLLREALSRSSFEKLFREAPSRSPLEPGLSLRVPKSSLADFLSVPRKAQVRCVLPGCVANMGIPSAPPTPGDIYKRLLLRSNRAAGRIRLFLPAAFFFSSSCMLLRSNRAARETKAQFQ